LLTSLVVNLPLLSTLSVSAQGESAADQEARRRMANQMLINAQLGGDFADPSTMIMMNAQRRGLIPGTPAIPLARPSNSPTSESTSFTGHSRGPFDGAPSKDGDASPFAQLSSGGAGGNMTPHAASGMSAQQVFDRGCDKTAVSNFAEAIKDYDEAIKIDPNFGKAYANRGSARYNTGDHKGALADFDVAAKLMPENQAVSALRDQIRSSLR